MAFASNFGRILSPTFQPNSQAMGGKFLPTDISGLIGWYDFSDADTLFKDDGSTKVSSDGDSIYRVNDKSGGDNYGIQANASCRPTYKTGIKNSLSIARSDGNDMFDINRTISTSGNYTFFFALDYKSTSGGDWLFDTYSGRFVLVLDYDGLHGTGWNDGTWKTTTRVAYGWSIISYKFVSGGNGNVYKNGASIYSNSYTAKNLGSKICLFGDNSAGGFNGTTADFGEVLIYEYALSDTDRGKVETYLNNKWAIYS